MEPISKFELISTKISTDLPNYKRKHVVKLQEDRITNVSSITLKIEIGLYIYIGGISKSEPIVIGTNKDSVQNMQLISQ